MHGTTRRGRAVLARGAAGTRALVRSQYSCYYTLSIPGLEPPAAPQVGTHDELRTVTAVGGRALPCALRPLAERRCPAANRRRPGAPVISRASRTSAGGGGGPAAAAGGGGSGWRAAARSAGVSGDRQTEWLNVLGARPQPQSDGRASKPSAWLGFGFGLAS